MDLKDYLERRSEKIPECGCWIWLGATNDDGYGLRYTPKRALCHRLSYGAFVGPIPGGMKVLHQCDVRLCVNPAHLYVGSQLQNIADRVRRGRGGGAKIRGVLHKNAKVTEADIREIRQSTLSVSALARQHHLGRTQIKRIRDGKAWTHIGDGNGTSH